MSGGSRAHRPGELALVTAGRAIAYSEQSPARHPAVLQGAQLWIALPAARRAVLPFFEHHRDLPRLTGNGGRSTVLLGEFAGARSPGTAHSPVVGVDIALAAGADVQVPLEPDFEHAVLAADGTAVVARPVRAGG